MSSIKFLAGIFYYPNGKQNESSDRKTTLLYGADIGKVTPGAPSCLPIRNFDVGTYLDAILMTSYIRGHIYQFLLLPSYQELDILSL